MDTGYISIDSYPPGASIYIDGVLVLDDKGEVGTTPAVLTVITGYHSIKLTLNGYCDENDGRIVMAGENVEVFHNFYIC